MAWNGIGQTFADDWRAGYPAAMDRVRTGELPWLKIDALHRLILDDLLDRAGIAAVPEADLDDAQPRVAPARPVAGLRGGPDAAQEVATSSRRCRTATCRC